MSTPTKTPAASKRLQSAKSSAPAGATVSSAPTTTVHGSSSSSASYLLDVFPIWSEQQPADKEDKNAGRYEDPLGLSLPPAAEPFCDAWKRADELLQGSPAVPMVCLKPAVAGADASTTTAADVKKGKEVVTTSRELDGKLYAGHETFEWLLAVITYVMAAEKWCKKGDYLWELISPKDKDGSPARSATGKYRVKLFLLDTWRGVTVDDRIPLDLFGRPLLVGSRPLQLWPLLLCKAILKVQAVYRSLDKTLPHQVAAFQMLTGWPQEDLLDALGGTPIAAGALFDRLEDVLPGPMRQVQGLPGVASCCLLRRSKPQRAPPRLLVLSGASAAGRSQLVARLLAEYPDKFGVTVSHTSRPPREHEVDGKDYHFTTKQQLMAGVRAKAFLEAARVQVHHRPCTSSAAAAAAAPPKPLSFWYGTSLATVREVAATGKLCVMSLDMQGAEALRSNPRIDGLYVYVSTSSPDVLAQRQKQRRSEAASTLGKRLAWAKQQAAKSSTAGLFDNVIVNTGVDEAYNALKEAISKLSPIIRNRLRGLPAYVLDYSDLIPPNSVEKPFLKPVILSGPHTGERRRLLEMLVEEFPDVFAFPRQFTTRPADLHSRHVGADEDELHLVAEQAVSSAAGNAGSAAAEGCAMQADAVGTDAAQPNANSSSDVNQHSREAVLGPPPCVLSKEAFEAAAAGGQLLEHHADQFVHPLAAFRHGHSMEDIQQIIQAGKLPLLELEAEQTELIKLTKRVDCLSVFLMPPSLEQHEQRLQLWATETDGELADRRAAAVAELASVHAKGVFDQVLTNDDLEDCYQQLKAAISRFRPELVPPPTTHEASCNAAQQATAANSCSPLVVAGPAGAGREQLVQQLLQRFPQRFAMPKPITDRKPAKGDKETAPDVDFVKPEGLSKLAAQGQLVWSAQDASTGSTTAVTVEAVAGILATGKMALLDVGTATADQLQAMKQHPALKQAFIVYVSRQAALKASLAAAGTAEAAAAALITNLTASEKAVRAVECLVQACVTSDEPEEAFSQLQVPLSEAFPGVVPPLLQPLVVAGPFGSNKRAVLQKLVAMLPDVLAVPKVVTSKPHLPGQGAGMEVVPLEVAQQMLAAGQFLVHEEVLGHHYGITSAAVRKLQALGKLPLLDLDRVQDVEKLRSSGIQATFLYMLPSSLDVLQARITAEVLANPPLHYEPEEAAAKAAAAAVREAQAAAARPELFDAVVSLDEQELQAAIGELGLQLHQRYPSAVPSSFVWGFGRPLWDPSVRVLGRKPLRVMVLGPAASGKSMQCSMLAARFAVPHINVGDLLYAEVAAKTPLGLEAQRHMDSCKTVPDALLMGLLLERLKQPDCQAVGWVLDGFPHTRAQADQLTAAGHVPDKVVMLEGPHALLLNRAKFRRIDYTTGKVYHMAEAGALSEAVKPLKSDGAPDAEVTARLSVRHDDSPQNVANRLALWDSQEPGLRAAYEDVLRLPAAGAPAAIFARAESFVQLEALLPSGPDASVHGSSAAPLVESWQLEEQSYRIVANVRYKRQQLVQLQQMDGRLFWCSLRELATNCSCMLLAHNPQSFSVVKSSKHLDTNCIHQQQLLMVDSPEPFKLVACLSMGPQHPALPPPAAAKKVFVLVGPAGSGRSSLAQLLLSDFPSKLLAAPVLTNRAPQPLEVAKTPELAKWRQQPGSAAATTTPTPAGDALAAGGSSSTAHHGTPLVGTTPCSTTSAQWPGSDLFKFVPEQQFKLLQQSQQLAGVNQHMGHSYAVSTAALETAAKAGKAALVVGSVHLAEKLLQDLADTQVICVYVDVDTGSLDQRLRQLAEVDEQCLQSLLVDAAQQKDAVQALQAHLLRDQLQPQQPSCVPAAQATAASPGKGASPCSKPIVQLPPPVTLPSTSAPSSTRAGGQHHQWQWQVQQQQQQPPGGLSAAAGQQPAVFTVANPNHQLQVCYTHIKGLLAKHWPLQQQFQPGLLLLQHHPASGALPSSSNLKQAATIPSAGLNSTTTATSATTVTALATVSAVAATAPLGLGDKGALQGFSATALRLRALTAASSQLVLPRGRHLLQLHCCPSQLHCVTFHTNADFILDGAEQLLPAACKLHVLRESGDVAGLPAGSRQLLFRYLIKPSEACSVSIQYLATSTALQACAQVMLLDVSTGRPLPQLHELQLPPSDKGYLLLAVAEPLTAVPPGNWSFVLTSSHRLALTEVPCSRQLVFTGLYAPNAKAVLARFVIAPTVAVNIAVLAQLRLSAAPPDADTAASPAGADAVSLSLPQPSSGAASCSNRSRDDAEASRMKLPLSFSLQVHDTNAAKEIAWHASYHLMLSSQCSDAGPASIPNLHLPPGGKYLLVLQLHQEGSRQCVDPATGHTTPLPEWQLQLMPGVDDKVCPIVADDSWQRHCEATREAWQQQAVAAAAAAAGVTSAPTTAGRPGSSGAKAAAAAAKDRPKHAQAALERHMAAAAAAAAATADQVSRPDGSASVAQATARSAAAAPSTPSSGSSSHQATTAYAAGAAAHASSPAAVGGRKPPATAAVKPKPAAAAAVAAATQQAGGAMTLVASAAGGSSVAAGGSSGAGGCDASAQPAGAVSQGYHHQQTARVWPGAQPAVQPPLKQPSEVLIRQVKSSGTADVLQLSPADQVRLLVVPEHHHSASTGGTSSSSSSSRSTAAEVQLPSGSISSKQECTAAAAAGSLKVLTAHELSTRLELLQLAATHQADALAQAASNRAQLHAATVQRAEQQGLSFTNWRDGVVAHHQAALLHKQNIVHSLFPPPAAPPSSVPATAAAAPSSSSSSHKGGADKVSAAKAVKA